MTDAQIDTATRTERSTAGRTFRDRTAASASPSTSESIGRGSDRPPGLLLGLLLTGQLMAILDVFIVNVAAPSIQRDLHASGAALQLVIAGYTIAYAVLLITGARLGERHGFGRLFLVGVAGFTAASLACGLAPGTGTLIGFRVAQGVGAALMVPQVMSLIQRTFTGQARVRALGAYTAVLACGGAIGQVLGGLLVSADLLHSGWRPVFLVNVPIGVVLLVLGRRVLPRDVGNQERRLDLAGLLALAGALGLLVVPLVLGREEHWPLWGWLMMGGSVLLGVVFVAVERRVQERGGSPLISGRVLRAPGLLPSVSAVFLTLATVGGLLFALALHLQSGLGDTALRAGLSFLPMSVGFGLSGRYWMRLPERWHGPLPSVALLLGVVNYPLLGWLLHGGGRLSAGVEVLLFVQGLVGGCSYSPLIGRALARVAPEDAADGSGVVVTVIQLGQVVGVATLGTLFLGQVAYPATAARSGHAFAVTTVAVGAVLLLAAAFATRTWRVLRD
jgi:MFS family permease